MSEEFTPEQIESAERAAAILLGDDSYKLQDMLDRGVTVVGGSYRIRRTVRVPSYAHIRDCTVEFTGEGGACAAFALPEGTVGAVIENVHILCAPALIVA